MISHPQSYPGTRHTILPEPTHVRWHDEDYIIARDCMMEVLRNRGWSINENSGGISQFDDAFQHAVGILALNARPLDPAQTEMKWRDGAPTRPWSQEWFIAKTTYGDRLVLRALPDEWTYDFTTADETYIKADKIKCWMQFPDSNYISPDASSLPSTDRLSQQRQPGDSVVNFNGRLMTWDEIERAVQQRRSALTSTDDRSEA